MLSSEEVLLYWYIVDEDYKFAEWMNVDILEKFQTALTGQLSWLECCPDTQRLRAVRSLGQGTFKEHPMSAYIHK